MNFNADVLPCLQNIEICIHKLKQLGLLNRDQRCPNCQEMCFWTKYSKSKDDWAWKCQTKLCQNYKNYISIRKGSFFANSNILLPKWLHLMYLWATKASNSFLIEITMLLIILLGISIYSTNFELFSAVSVWGGGGGERLFTWSVWGGGGGGRDSSLDPKRVICVDLETQGSESLLIQLVHNLARRTWKNMGRRNYLKSRKLSTSEGSEQY